MRKDRGSRVSITGLWKTEDGKFLVNVWGDNEVIPEFEGSTFTKVKIRLANAGDVHVVEGRKLLSVMPKRELCLSIISLLDIRGEYALSETMISIVYDVFRSMLLYPVQKNSRPKR